MPWTLEDSAVGARLAALRKAACLTQYQLALMSEVGFQTISRYERGEVRVPCAVADRLARVLKCKAWQILYGDD